MSKTPPKSLKFTEHPIFNELNNNMRPTQSYDLNKKNLCKWYRHVLKCNPYEKDPRLSLLYNLLITTIKKNVQYVSWTTLYENLVKCIDECLKNIPINTKIAVVIGGIKKSNYWMAKHFLFYVKEHSSERVPNIFIVNYESIPNVSHIVFVDDASYSGLQMHDNLSYCNSLKNVQVHVIVPYMTDVARKRISCDNSHVNIYSINTLTTLAQHIAASGYNVWDGVSDYNEKDESSKEMLANTIEMSFMLRDNFTYDNNNNAAQFKKYFNVLKSKSNISLYEQELREFENYNITYIVPLYFQHKIPDAVSSLPTIFASGKVSNYCCDRTPIMFIDNCEGISEKDAESLGSISTKKCAEPFYKVGGSSNFNEAKASITHLMQADILVKREYVRYNNRRYRVMTKNKKKYIMVKSSKVLLESAS